jgi:hypothetical protein
VVIVIAWKLNIHVVRDGHEKSSSQRPRGGDGASDGDGAGAGASDGAGDGKTSRGIRLARYMTPLFVYNVVVTVLCCWVLIDNIQEKNNFSFGNSLQYYSSVACPSYEVCISSPLLICVIIIIISHCVYMLFCRVSGHWNTPKVGNHMGIIISATLKE